MQTNVLEFYTIPEGDWEVLYVNGKLEVEGHRIRIEDISEFVPIGLVRLRCVDNFDSDEDYFPEKVEDFPNHWDISTSEIV